MKYSINFKLAIKFILNADYQNEKLFQERKLIGSSIRKEIFPQINSFRDFQELNEDALNYIALIELSDYIINGPVLTELLKKIGINMNGFKWKEENKEMFSAREKELLKDLRIFEAYSKIQENYVIVKKIDDEFLQFLKSFDISIVEEQDLEVFKSSFLYKKIKKSLYGFMFLKKLSL